MFHKHCNRSVARRTKAIAAITAVLFAAFCGLTHAQVAVTPPGDGTSSDPYRISELSHLVWMSETVADSAGKYYTMTADIDASPTAAWNDPDTSTDVLEGFKPIGSGHSVFPTTIIPFAGYFDGKGYTIQGLVINRPGTMSVGLFGVIDDGAQVSNLGLVGDRVIGDCSVGMLVGQSAGTISNCYATGVVNGTRTDDVMAGVGGLVGDNDGSIDHCYATGSVTDTGLGSGGLVGWNYQTISDSYATGAVSSPQCTGGLAGLSMGTITNCYATGSVEGTRWYDTGGLVGYNWYGTISNCYATGSVNGKTGVGGLLGDNQAGTVFNCYATGPVTGVSQVGGLVGYNWYWENDEHGLDIGVVSRCYSIGTVTGDTQVGGLIGFNDLSTVSDSYWDVERSGLTTSDGGSGKSTAEMKQQATFAGWDFTNIWAIQEELSYPFLRAFNSHPAITPPGSGAENDPYQISQLGHLAWMSLTAADSAGKFYTMTADIDASPTAAWNDPDTSTEVLEGFKPIGRGGHPLSANQHFKGVFEGNGHTISGLVVNRPDDNLASLFGLAGSGAEVRNFTMAGGQITGSGSVGGIVGETYMATVSNCSTSAAVKGVGAEAFVGGIVGFNNGTVFDCRSTGEVSSMASYDVGGIVGLSMGEIGNCRAIGPVSGQGIAGGLVGTNYGGTVSDSFAAGTVSCTEFTAGGLVAYNLGTVLRCYATGAVSGQGGAGGLIGFNHSGTVANCYSTGAVSGQREIGGLVGSTGLFVDTMPGSISNCYATGVVTGTEFVGGLVGQDDLHIVSDSYWDMQSTGQSSSAGGTGKSTAEMKQPGTFEGWNFAEVWGIRENRCYPYLRGVGVQPPAIVTAVSRKVHGEAGGFDLDLLSTPAVESRRGGVTQLVVGFDGPIQGVTGSTQDVSVSLGTVESVEIEGSQLTVQLSGVADRQSVSIGFAGVKDAAGYAVTDTLCVGSLLGDASRQGGGAGDGAVNIFDIIRIKGVLDRPVNTTNSRCDVAGVGNGSSDGLINIYDLIAIKSNFDKTLVGLCP